MLWYFLIPVLILAGLLLILGVFALLARVRGGRYLRPIMAVLMRVPFLGRSMKRASKAALERSNPDLANAIKKLERAGAGRDPQRAQKALGTLTPAERRAYMELAGQQGVMPEPQNRQQRRKMSRVDKRS